MVKNIDTGKPLTREDKKSIAEAAEIISNVFDWGTTEQGVIYWDEVHDHLVTIAYSPDEPVKCESCGRKLPDAE